MTRLRALEPDGTEHFVPCAPCVFLRSVSLLSLSARARRRALTSEETVQRLAQVVYAAEVEAKPAAAPSAAAAAAPAGEGGAEAAEASHAFAVDSLLKARAELEVRAQLEPPARPGADGGPSRSPSWTS